MLNLFIYCVSLRVVEYGNGEIERREITLQWTIEMLQKDSNSVELRNFWLKVVDFSALLLWEFDYPFNYN